MKQSGFRAIFIRSLLQIVRRPVYWVGFFLLPLFGFFLLTNEMEEGLPELVPAAIIDKDGSSMSRQVSQTLSGMQNVDIIADCNSFTEGRHKMQEGEIFGFFLIPENFERDLLAGRSPSITFYTNMTYYVPASLLFKTFKATALYTKAGVMLNVAEAAGIDGTEVMPLLQPINIQARGIGNPWLNYGPESCS